MVSIEAPLSDEADALLAAAVAEMDSKQRALLDDWHLSDAERWQFDEECALLRLDYLDGTQVVCNAQLIGTFAKEDCSFEWSWNNPRYQNHLTVDSRKVQEKGETLRLQYLQLGMVPLPSEEYLHFLCAIAVKITGAAGIFHGGGEVSAVFTLHNLKRMH